jgi:hypothetical protein
MLARKPTVLLYQSLVMIIVLAACSTVNSISLSASSVDGTVSPSGEPPVDSPASPPTQSAHPTNALPPSGMPSPTATISPSPTPSPTAIPSATHTPTPSITPIYAILRGIVLEQSNCRYGPGAAYLYKYGLYEDNHLEVIGRNETGSWVVVQAIGGTNPCWIKASLMDIQGDVTSLAPMRLPLPQSPYYGPLTGVNAQRNGDEVIISWNTLSLKAGDDSEQYPYLVEAWLCQDGELQFNAIGSWETIVGVRDEAGCAELSHARVYGVEKHGYTAWVNIPWPAH